MVYRSKVAEAYKVGKRKMGDKKSKLELWLDYHNHEMELIRTIVPIILLGLQVVILAQLVGK